MLQLTEIQLVILLCLASASISSYSCEILLAAVPLIEMACQRVYKISMLPSCMCIKFKVRIRVGSSRPCYLGIVVVSFETGWHLVIVTVTTF